MEATQEVDINATRKRSQFLEGRVKALQAQLADAAENESATAGKLAAAKNGLTDGSTKLDDVTRASRALQDAADGRDHVQAALDNASRELGEAKGTIASHETAEERKRQDEAAEPLRKQAQEQLAAFASAFAGLRGMLIDFGHTGRQLETSFPLATPIAHESFDQIAETVRKCFHNVGGMEARPEYHTAYRNFVIQTLMGPFRDGAEFREFLKQARLTQ
jgi:chromosome segregation ATPase